MKDIAGFAQETVQRARRVAERRAHPARATGSVPGVRARDRGEPQGLLVLVARGPRLRVRDLEGQSRQAAAGGGRARADPLRLHRAARHRLPRPQRPQLPRAPGPQPDRGGQMARRVRRAVGARGRQAARERDGGERARRRRRARPRAAARHSRTRRRSRGCAAARAWRVPAGSAGELRVGRVREDGLRCR